MSGEIMCQTYTEDKFLSMCGCACVDKEVFIRSAAASPGLFTV